MAIPRVLCVYVWPVIPTYHLTETLAYPYLTGPYRMGDDVDNEVDGAMGDDDNNATIKQEERERDR